MGSDNYTTAVVGGGLKLKGGTAKPAGVKKKKKDKSKSNVPKEAPSDSRTVALQDALAEEEEEEAAAGASVVKADGIGKEDKGEREGGDDGELGEGDGGEGGGKTEAERRYEEMRRKRLDERIRKEGVKTHKQRVEELNRYLSALSEHHDMPRIGPG